MINKVIILGYLGQDPELKYTKSGSAVCSLSIATTKSYKDKNGTKQSTTQWHRVIFWGKPAETIAEYMRKGSLMYVEGEITSRTYEDKNGQEKTITEILGNSFQFIDRKSEDKQQKQTKAPEFSKQGSFDDDEIPF